MKNELPSLPRDAAALAPTLGWFSLALGLTELLAPRMLCRRLGMRGSERLLQVYGLREMAAGAGILCAGRPAPWLWSRVAGDVLDIATLLAAAQRPRPHSKALGSALAMVLGITALDIACARASMRRPGDALQATRQPARDYSDRSGLPQPPDAMRGAAIPETSGRRWERRNLA